MRIYLVGGAVRDGLLGLPVHDRDWVVTGATPAQMLALGYQQVGRDFPVFLHPESKEEYALARTERKSGQGYHGFICDFSPATTLEEDLKRRDLSINAMAQDENGRIIDPFGGQKDIQKRLLRHVSPAFSEDPLRVLRLLRFYARFAAFGFRIAPETEALCRAMIAAGELNHLARERIWQECERALMAPRPDVFFKTLAVWEALSLLGLNAQKALNFDFPSAATAPQRWALLLEKQERSAFYAALPVPKSHRYWIELLHNHGHTLRGWRQATAVARLAALQAAGSLRGEGDIIALARLLALDEGDIEKQRRAVQAVQARDLLQQGLAGASLGEALRRAQLAALERP